MKRFRKPLTLFFFLTVLHFSTLAQTKIGYVNVEIIMANMPEMTQVNSTMQSFESKLAQQLNTKQQYAQQRLQEYQQKMQAKQYNTITQKEAENEIMRLDKDITEFTQNSQNQILQKRTELMTPLTDKLQKVIDEVAAEGGFTYVLNQTINGVSNVLFAPKESNLNIPVMKKLGIEIGQDN